MSLLNEGITKSTKKRLTRASIRTGLLLLIICLISGSTDKCPGCQEDINEFNVVEGSETPIITEVGCTGEPVYAKSSIGDTKVYGMLPLKSCGAPRGVPSIDITFFVRSLAKIIVKIDGVEIDHSKYGEFSEDPNGYFFSKTKKCNPKTWKWNIEVHAPKVKRYAREGFNIEIQCVHPFHSDEKKRKKVYSTGIQVKFRPPVVTLTPDRQCVNPKNGVTFEVKASLAETIYFECDSSIGKEVEFNTTEFYDCTFTTKPFTPEVETEYKVIAKGPGGEAEATCTVSVCKVPKVTSFEAYPQKICPGGRSTLSWKAKGAIVELKEEGANGKTWNVTDISSKVVGPTMNTTYKITAFEAGESQSSTTTVTVLNGEQSTTIVLNWGAKDNCPDNPDQTTECYGGQWIDNPALDGCEAIITKVKGVTPGHYTIFWMYDGNHSGLADVYCGGENLQLKGKTVEGRWYGSWQNRSDPPKYIEIEVFWEASKKK